MIVALLAGAVLAVASPPPQRVAWEDTAEVFAGRQAVVRLESDVVLVGVWLGVTPETFTVDVTSAEGKGRPAKGVHTFPRSAIKEVGLRERRSSGRLAGVLIIVLPAAALSATTPAGAFLLPMLIVQGFMAGRAADLDARPVHIEPPSVTDQDAGCIPGEGGWGEPS
jgi:hypothetical protein